MNSLNQQDSLKDKSYRADRTSNKIQVKLLNEKFSLIPNAVIDLPQAINSANKVDNGYKTFKEANNEKNNKKQFKHVVLSKSITFNVDTPENDANSKYNKGLISQGQYQKSDNQKTSKEKNSNNYYNINSSESPATKCIENFINSKKQNNSNSKADNRSEASKDTFYLRLMQNLDLDNKLIVPDRVKQREFEM